MATTATRVSENPSGSMKRQLWRVSIGAGDTTAVFKTGLYNVLSVKATTDSDQAFGGVFKNSNNTTEGSLGGSVSINGLANSSVLDVEVLGN